MATCGALSGMGKQCPNYQAGISEVYIAAVDSFDNIGYSITGGTVTGFTGTETLSAYTYKFFKNTAQADEAETINETGGRLIEQTITLQFTKMEAAKRNEIILLSQNDVIVITKDRNDKYHLYGAYNGLMVSANSGSGKNMNDFNGYTLTLKGQATELAPEVSLTALTSILRS